MTHTRTAVSLRPGWAAPLILVVLLLGAGVAEDLLREAKVGILLGSLLAALVGGLVLWADLRAEGR